MTNEVDGAAVLAEALKEQVRLELKVRYCN